MWSSPMPALTRQRTVVSASAAAAAFPSPWSFKGRMPSSSPTAPGPSPPTPPPSPTAVRSSSARRILDEVRGFLFAGALYAVLFKLLAIASYVDLNDLTMNIPSILSHMFFIMIVFICFKSVYLACYPTNQVITSSVENIIYYLKQRSMITALIVIISPLLLTVKIIYAFSLLTASGQCKASSFVKYERIHWERFYEISNNIIKTLWNHDLARFSVSACIPLYLLLLSVMHLLNYFYWLMCINC